jgi:hypothetical protein
VRQVVDPEAEIELMNSYAPYGDLISSEGSFDTAYGYTGELTDSSGLFTSKDTWEGNYQNPIPLGEFRIYLRALCLRVRRILSNKKQSRSSALFQGLADLTAQAMATTLAA